MRYSWRFSDSKCVAHLRPDAFAAMLQQAISASPNETGGTLVGFYEGGDLVANIVQVIEAGPGAIQRPTKFVRPADEEDGALARVYDQSCGRLYYLGEWHSHPGSSASPSRQDKRSLKKLAQSSMVGTGTPLLIILGGSLKSGCVVSCTLFDAAGLVIPGVRIKGRPVS